MSKKTLVILAVVAVGLASGVGFMLGRQDSRPVDQADLVDLYIITIQGWVESDQCPTTPEVLELAKSTRAWAWTGGFDDFTPAQEDLITKISEQIYTLCPDLVDRLEIKEGLAEIIQADWLDSCPSLAEFEGVLDEAIDDIASLIDRDKIESQCPEILGG